MAPDRKAWGPAGPLSREQIPEIVDSQLERVIVRVDDRGVRLEITPAARELLGNMGYDPTYGVWPLRRVIQAVDRQAGARAAGGSLPRRRGRRGGCPGGQITLERALATPGMPG